MKKTIILIMTLILMSISVMAQPPFPETFTGNSGLSLESPPPRYSPLNAAAQTIVHVFNISNGVKMGNDTGVYCEGDLLDLDGSILYETNATPEEDHFIIGYPANLTSRAGTYGYTIYCQQLVLGTNVLGGFFTGYIEVNELGRTLDHEGDKSIAVMIGMGLLGLLILKLFNSLDEEHWLFKIFLMMALPVIFIIMGAIALKLGNLTTFENSARGFYTFATWFIRIFYTYLFGALIWTVFKSFKTKNEKKSKELR